MTNVNNRMISGSMSGATTAAVDAFMERVRAIREETQSRENEQKGSDRESRSARVRAVRVFVSTGTREDGK